MYFYLKTHQQFRKVQVQFLSARCLCVISKKIHLKSPLLLASTITHKIPKYTINNKNARHPECQFPG